MHEINGTLDAPSFIVFHRLGYAMSRPDLVLSNTTMDANMTFAATPVYGKILYSDYWNRDQVWSLGTKVDADNDGVNNKPVEDGGCRLLYVAVSLFFPERGTKSLHDSDQPLCCLVEC